MTKEVTHRGWCQVCALLLSVMGLYSLFFSYPFAFPALAGVCGFVFAVAGMRGQRGARWPLGAGALASAGVVAALLWPVEAGDALEFVGLYVWFGCSVFMLVVGFVAITWSFWEEPPKIEPPEW